MAIMAGILKGEKKMIRLLNMVLFGLILFMIFVSGATAQSLSGGGDGKLEIWCDGKPCNNNYEGGSTITIKATPNKDSTFVGWSGICTHSEPICQFTMPNRAVSVTAHFDKKAWKKKKSSL